MTYRAIYACKNSVRDGVRVRIALPRALITIASITAVTGIVCCSIFDRDMCSTEVEQELASPDGSYIATTFHRDCGATTGFNTQLALRDKGTDFEPESGKVLAIDGNHRLDLAWLSADRLEVTLPSDEKVYTKAGRWRDLQIEYKELTAER